MSEIISEYMLKVYDNEFNAKNTKAEETNNVTGEELILQTQELILESLSGLYEVLWQMMCDLYEIDGGTMKKILKEHNEWK